MLNYDNSELSFRELSADEQVRFLAAHIRALTHQLEQQKEQFATYEASDQKLLSQLTYVKVENERLKKKLGSDKSAVVCPPDTRLGEANNEIERLRKLIDAMGGDPDVPTNKKWYARIVRAYLSHYGIKTDELDRFVRYMSKARNADAETFFSIPVSRH